MKNCKFGRLTNRKAFGIFAGLQVVWFVVYLRMVSVFGRETASSFWTIILGPWTGFVLPYCPKTSICLALGFSLLLVGMLVVFTVVRTTELLCLLFVLLFIWELVGYGYFMWWI